MCSSTRLRGQPWPHISVHLNLTCLMWSVVENPSKHSALTSNTGSLRPEGMGWDGDSIPGSEGSLSRRPAHHMALRHAVCGFPSHPES